MTLIYRCLRFTAPLHLHSTRVADILLLVRRTRLVTDRTFPVAGDKLWNELLGDVTAS